MNDYEAKLREQQQQYASGSEISVLAPIFGYWAQRFVAPRWQAVFSTNSLSRVYSTPLKALLRAKASHCTFVSLGSGSCAEEIGIAQDLRAEGFSNFTIVGLEVAEHLIAEANAAIAREGLAGQVVSQFFDVNRQPIEGPVDAVIANQSLHHFVELERLFDLVEAALVPQGYFLTCDMIGRNGHMRWPETLRYVEAVWANLPDVKKFNWQFRECHHRFVNWDCSSTAFEGVRAQDILPLLIRKFDFEAFVGCGGFIDPFVDRGYGPNYSPENPLDCAFIDLLATANDALLASGEIKPTMIFAYMVKRGRGSTRPRVIAHLTPEFCVRVPD
jgi:SAM-dependent methyltransferase